MIATTIAVLAFLGALLAVVECVAMIKRFCVYPISVIKLV